MEKIYIDLLVRDIFRLLSSSFLSLEQILVRGMKFAQILNVRRNKNGITRFLLFYII